MNEGRLTILLAEDDEGHATLIQRSLARAGVSNELIHVRDGYEALEFVRAKRARREGQPASPLLLLLDLNMPRVNGFEVLEQLKADAETSHLPVIVLTTTDDARDIDRCYRLGCSVFVTKPVAYTDFMAAVQRLGLFLQIVSAPAV